MPNSSALTQANVSGLRLMPRQSAQVHDARQVPFALPPGSAAILAGCSLLLLARDTLTEPWLRESDVAEIGRHFSARDAKNPHAKAKFQHRSVAVTFFCDQLRHTGTGILLRQCVQKIAHGTRDGDGKYIRRESASSTSEANRAGMRTQVLTKRALAMVEKVRDQFLDEPLTPEVLLALFTCDRLLVVWYAQSVKVRANTDKQPDLADLQKARRNLMVNALVTRGYMKAHLDIEVGKAGKTITDFMSATIHQLNASARFDTLLHMSSQTMSDQLRATVRTGLERAMRQQKMVNLLGQQGLQAELGKLAWKTLSRLQDTLSVPAFLQPYLEQAAIDGGLVKTLHGPVEEGLFLEWLLKAEQTLLEHIKNGRARLSEAAKQELSTWTKELQQRMRKNF